MGAMLHTESAEGDTPDAALTTILDDLTADDPPRPDEGHEGWTDPYCKGWTQVWDKPVTDDAVEWMRGWCMQNPPDGVDPRDKWGPWLMFPLARGGWCFFGWVNT